MLIKHILHLRLMIIKESFKNESKKIRSKKERKIVLKRIEEFTRNIDTGTKRTATNTEN